MAAAVSAEVAEVAEAVVAVVAEAVLVEAVTVELAEEEEAAMGDWSYPSSNCAWNFHLSGSR
jgi:hypothetical protein